MAIEFHNLSARRTRAFVAVAFLFVILVEWGSHGLAFAHGAPIDGLVAVSAGETPHDDPCRTTVCCESRRSDRTLRNLSHDISPNVLFIYTADESLRSFLLDEPPYSRNNARRIFRPMIPLLHPPEFS